MFAAVAQSWLLRDGVLDESTPRTGHCGATEYGGDCASGSQGAWDANRIGVRSVQACAAHCRAHCPRCNYVSYRNNLDCSWYIRCPRLQRSFGGGQYSSLAARTVEAQPSHQKLNRAAAQLRRLGVECKVFVVAAVIIVGLRRGGRPHGEEGG